MRRPRNRLSLSLWVSLAGAVLFLARPPAARAEGPGVVLGDQLVLHPGIALELRYDSNIFFQDVQPRSSFILRVLPSLDMATRPFQRGGGEPHAVDFRLHAGLDYVEYLTSDQNITSHRSIGVNAGALLTLGPNRPLSLDLFDNFVRTTQAPYHYNPYNLDRDTNQLGLRARWKPGGGRLSLDLGYFFAIDYFEPNRLQDFDLYSHAFDLHVSWKFLPKTALYIDVSETLNHYPTPGTSMHPDSDPLRAVAGIQGLITTKLSLNGWVGYGNGFYATGPSPSEPIGGLMLRWKPTILTNTEIGYRHDFVNSLLGSYYELDEAHLGLSQLLWRITAGARFAYEHIAFTGIPAQSAVVPPGNRADDYFVFNFRLDYPFKDWLIASAGYDLQYNTSASKVAISCPAGMPGCPAGLLPVDYTKHEGWLRLSLLY